MGQPENELTSETLKYLQQMQDINQMMYDLFTRMFHAIWKVFQALVRRSRTHHLSNMAYFCTYAEMQRTYGAGLLLSRWSPLSFWLRHKSEIIIVCAVLSFRTSNNQQVQQSWRTAELIGEASFLKLESQSLNLTWGFQNLHSAAQRQQHVQCHKFELIHGRK